MLQNVEARGKNPPPRRLSVCPEDGYVEWDRHRDALKRGMLESSKEQVLVIHRAIARRKSSRSPKLHWSCELIDSQQTVWKDSIIKPSWSSSDNYPAFATRASESGGYDMYIDYRDLAQDWVSGSRTDIDPAPGVPTSREYFGAYSNNRYHGG